MKIKEIITEGLSRVLFHKTGIMNLIKILEFNSFQPSGVVKPVEIQFKTSADQLYYVSFARSKRSAYMTDTDGKVSVSDAIIVVDGRNLQNNYSGSSVDYWQSSVFGHEMEDRLYTHKPDIPNASKYIKEVNLFFPDPRTDSEILGKMQEERKEQFFRYIRMVIKLCKQLNIDLYIHKTTSSMLAPRPTDLVNPRTFFETRPEPESRRDLSGLRNKENEMINVIKELIYKDDIDDLSKRARSYAFDFRRGRVSDDFIRQMETALHNDATDPDKLNPILQTMRQNGIKTIRELAEVIADTWSEDE